MAIFFEGNVNMDGTSGFGLLLYWSSQHAKGLAERLIILCKSWLYKPPVPPKYSDASRCLIAVVQLELGGTGGLPN